MNTYNVYDLPDGQTSVPEGRPFRLADVQYPANFLELATPDELSALGISKRSVPVNLAALKATLKTRVDADAEAVRGKYITPGYGMALTYQEKHKQAEAVDDLGEAAANALTEAERNAQFPTLSASVGIEASTLWACAQLVIDRYEVFDSLAHQIERTRLQSKKAISDASDAAAAHAAYEAITWPV